MKRRIFIESDILHKDELETAQDIVANVLEDMGESFIKNVFDETFDFAWHKEKLPNVWAAIKKSG